MNIGYYFILIMFGFILQIPCFLSLMIAYPLFLLTKSRKVMKIPSFLQKRVFDWTDRLFFQTTYFKSQRIKENVRYVYLPNHQAFMDPVIARNVLTNPSQYMVTIAIAYAKYIPLMGPNLAMMGIPFIGDKATGQLVNKGLVQMYTEYLQENKDAVLALFPEGKRTFNDQFLLEDLRTGGFVIAKNLGQQIVPVYHNIRDRFDDVNQHYDKKPKVYCIYGDPIDVEGKEIQDIRLEYFNEMIKLKSQIDKLRGNELKVIS